MAKLFRAEQMRAADQAAMQAGIASILLMEAASRQVTTWVLEACKRYDCTRVLVLCGKGNNGGDGYAVARHVAATGREVVVLEHTQNPDELGEDSRMMRRACAVTVAINPLDVDTLTRYLQPDTLVVDALLGSGLNRALAGALCEVVKRVNHAPFPVVSVDVPTGVSADSGQRLGEAIRADITVQLAGAKLASALEPARSHFGEQVVVDIGIPEPILDAQADIAWVDDEMMARALPFARADTHKYRAGTVLVIAGSPRYAGAAELACRGALRSGAGLVTLASSSRHSTSWPEIILEPLDWHADPLAVLRNLDAKRAHALVIGPGLDAKAAPLLGDVLAHFAVPIVLDAGALTGGDGWFETVTAHSRDANNDNNDGQVVITPHIGEAARLLGVSSRAVSADVVSAAKKLAERSGAITVLKGATTVIASQTHTAISTAGHPGMATGGSGDVLAGVIGAVLAATPQEEACFERVCAAVHWHGRAGEHAAVSKGTGLLPQDLIEALAVVRTRLTP